MKHFSWDNNGVSPGYIKVNAQAENDVELVTSVNGKEIQLKYLEDSYWGGYLERKAYSFVKTQYLDDYTFEVDDDGNPYWVVTKYDKTIGLSGNKTSGCLIINAQNGEGKEYSINDTPEWVDRIQPTDMTINNLNYAGKYVHGFLNSITSKKSLTKTAEGINVIYNNDKCYYYTGVTSVGKDESLIGFYLTDTRTGETKMYKTAGATEEASMKSAEGKVQQFGYEAKSPVLINLQSQPTYFMTLVDKKGLIKGYSFVNVEQYSMVSYGETIKDSYANYIKLLTGNDKASLKNASDLLEVKGAIDRIGMAINQGCITYNLMLKDDNRLFKISDTFDEVTLSKVGESVTIKYIENSNIINAKEFDNTTIQNNN